MISVEVKGRKFRNVSRPDIPVMRGVQLLSSNPSTSSSFEFVNGQASSTYTYSYFAVCRQEGEFTIPPFGVVVDGTVFTTNAIKIKAQSKRAPPPSTSQGNQNSYQRELPDIFLEMELSNKNPVVGEQLVAEIVLFFKSTIDVQSYQPIPGWKADGFWKEELSDGKQPQAISIIRQGQRYRKATLVKYALFPSKSGDLELGPFQVNATIRYSVLNRDPFSSFFGGFGANQKSVELETEPMKVNVEAFPETDEGFIGAVGQFRIRRSASVEEALVGETIEIRTEVSGTGNIALIGRPEYEFPENLEVYEPQESQNINRRGTQISGTKTFTDVVIGRRPGTVVVPPTTLSYYDNSKNQIVRVALPEISLNIKQDPRFVATPGVSITLDVQPVVGLVAWSQQSDINAFTVQWWFWVLLGSPVLMLGVGYLSLQHINRLNSDENYARRFGASRKTQVMFKRADEAAQGEEIREAYSALHEALAGFITDKLSLPKAGLSDQEIVDAMIEKGLSAEESEDLKSLLVKCSTIRFAPVADYSGYQNDRKMAEKLVKIIRSTT